MGWGETQHHWSVRVGLYTTLQSDRLLSKGTRLIGCHGRAFSNFTRQCGTFRGRTRNRKRKASKWFGEEQMWENRIKRQQDLVASEQIAGQYTCLAMYALHLVSSICPVFSLNSMSNYFHVWGLSVEWAWVFMGVLSASNQR